MYPNLNAEIGRKGLKKKDIASSLKLSPSALRLKLNGDKQFTLNEAFKFAEILGGDFSIEYLFQAGVA